MLEHFPHKWEQLGQPGVAFPSGKATHRGASRASCNGRNALAVLGEESKQRPHSIADDSDLGTLLQQRRRMDCANVVVSREIPLIEGQNTPNAMNSHRRHQSSVVDLHAGNRVLDHDCPPRPVHCRVVRQQLQTTLDGCGALVRLAGVETEPVAVDRPRTGIPELAKILRGVAKHNAMLKQTIDNSLHEWIIAVIGLDPANEDVAINQMGLTRFGPRKSSPW